MLRVARIVTEFCARTRPGSGVTPCAGRNKEFLARRVFYLFNCCTNVIVRNRRPEAGGQTAYRLLTTDYWFLCVYRFAGTSGEIVKSGKDYEGQRAYFG